MERQWPVLQVGAGVRTRLRDAVVAASAGGAVCLLLTVVATQDRAVRAHSPWQDDPYDVVVSFSLLLLPGLLVAGMLRVPACRAVEAMPVARAHDILRWARLVAGVAALCVVTEWASVLDGSNGSAWGTSGRWLIAMLAVVTVVVATAGVLILRASRLADPAWGRVDGPDWLADWSLVARRTSAGLRSAAGLVEWTDAHVVSGRRGVRRHPLAAAAVICLVSGVAIAVSQGIGEQSLGLDEMLLFTVVSAGTLFGFLVAAGAYLGIVRGSPAPPRPGGRVTLRATIAATAAIPVTVAFRSVAGPRLEHLGLLGLVIAVAAAVWVATAAAGFAHAWRRGRAQ